MGRVTQKLPPNCKQAADQVLEFRFDKMNSPFHAFWFASHARFHFHRNIHLLDTRVEFCSMWSQVDVLYYEFATTNFRNSCRVVWIWKKIARLSIPIFREAVEIDTTCNRNRRVIHENSAVMHEIILWTSCYTIKMKNNAILHVKKWQ